MEGKTSRISLLKCSRKLGSSGGPAVLGHRKGNEEPQNSTNRLLNRALFGEALCRDIPAGFQGRMLCV